MTPGRAVRACSGICLGHVPERWQANRFWRALMWKKNVNELIELKLLEIKKHFILKI